MLQPLTLWDLARAACTCPTLAAAARKERRDRHTQAKAVADAESDPQRQLKVALASRGLELRSDSALCSAYICGSDGEEVSDSEGDTYERERAPVLEL